MNIVLDIQGQIFKTTYDTIIKIPYFMYMLEDCGMPKDNIFINRSPLGFAHILAWATEPLHPFPIEYEYELNFYNIDKSQVIIYDIVEQCAKRVQLQSIKCNQCDELLVGRAIHCDEHNMCMEPRCYEIIEG